MTLIDLHSHVLPAVDDGARDDTEALAMLAAAQHDGTQRIAATPHASLVERSVIVAGVQHLNAIAREQGLTITVVTGSEVRFDADLAARYRAGELVTLDDTPYLLIELSLRAEWSPYLQQGIYDLQVEGALPILAHAERYPTVQRHPDVLLDLIAQGVLVQVNADSVTGRGSRNAMVTAETLLRRRMVHVIASDAHGVRERPPLLSAAVRRCASIADRAHADWMLSTPARILAGEVLNLPDPLLSDRTGLLTRFRSRAR